MEEQRPKKFRAAEGFYDTIDDHEALIVRPRELQENVVPSGNAMAALVLARLSGRTGCRVALS